MSVLGYCKYGTGALSPFDQVFDKGVPIELADRAHIKGLDAVIVWGGADISPTIYNEPVSEMTGARKELSQRDIYEVEVCKIAIEEGIPIIGICRGAQLACAMAGGKLVQHVNGHGRSHPITTNDGRCLLTSSVHHQMMYPWNVEHDLIAWSSNSLSDTYVGGDNSEMDMENRQEPEVVWFPKIKALAIQGHPEFMRPDSAFVQYCMELTKQYVLCKEEIVC